MVVLMRLANSLPELRPQLEKQGQGLSWRHISLDEKNRQNLVLAPAVQRQ